MADPSWFPNTTYGRNSEDLLALAESSDHSLLSFLIYPMIESGLGISAVKAWLYFPTAGHFLMAVS
jgi:hypothetical protein